MVFAEAGGGGVEVVEIGSGLGVAVEDVGRDVVGGDDGRIFGWFVCFWVVGPFVEFFNAALVEKAEAFGDRRGVCLLFVWAIWIGVVGASRTEHEGFKEEV